MMLALANQSDAAMNSEHCKRCVTVFPDLRVCALSHSLDPARAHWHQTFYLWLVPYHQELFSNEPTLDFDQMEHFVTQATLRIILDRLNEFTGKEGGHLKYSS